MNLATSIVVLAGWVGGPTAQAVPEQSACPGVEALTLRSNAPGLRSGEELSYRLTAAGAYIGRLETKLGEPRTEGGSTVWPLFGRARTNALVSSIKPFVGRYMTMLDPDSFRPVGLQTELTYGDDPRWERVRFRAHHRKVEATYFARGREGARAYVTDHAASDLLTLLYTARRVDLQPGLTACQDVFGARRLWRMTGRVTGVERISTPVGKKDAYRLELHFVRKPHPSLRGHRPPVYDLVAFLAKDAYQTPLRFELTVDGITAVGHLESWRLGTSGR